MGPTPSWTLIGAMNTSNLVIDRIDHSLLVQRATGHLEDADAGALSRDGGTAAALLVPTRGPATMPAELAAHDPAARQAQAQALFQDLLGRYRAHRNAVRHPTR